MSGDENWGPWIEHDGNGCPCRGMLVEVQWESFADHVHRWAGIVTPFWEAPFDWSNYCVTSSEGRVWGRVIRYRVRKPKGLTILETLLQDLPTTVDA